MKTIAIIPARLSSTRFPDKPLKEICGIPMIGHIYLRTCKAKGVDAVYVATCDEAIAEYVRSIGGKAIMTNSTHERATERVAEAVDIIERETKVSPEFVVMVQGDEPLIRPESIEALVAARAANPTWEVINLSNDISKPEEYIDKNIVKLVYGAANKAIWFFRQPSPFWQDKVASLPIKIQTGIIAFTRKALADFVALAPTSFEKANSVDMCRLIENDRSLYHVPSPFRLYSVDTPTDLENVAKRMESDDLFSQYREYASKR